MLQAQAPPPGYFVRLENKTAENDLYLRKRTRMRRWLCCACHVEESYQSNENEHLKSPRNHADGRSCVFLLLEWVNFLVCCYLSYPLLAYSSTILNIKMDEMITICRSCNRHACPYLLISLIHCFLSSISYSVGRSELNMWLYIVFYVFFLLVMNFVSSL